MFSRARRRNFSARHINRRSSLFVRQLEDRAVPAAFIVNVATDASGVAGGAGTGNTGDLRYCIAQANLTPALDTITFDSTTFGAASTITIDPVLLGISITADLTINGPAAKLTLSGNMASDILNSSGDTVTLAAINVTLTDLTLDSGKILAESGNAFFANLTKLSMTGVTVSNNYGEANGAAVVVVDGSISATSTTFSGNQLANTLTAQAGGAIVLVGTTTTGTFNTCTFTGNSATGAAGTSGGAIATIGSTGAISLTKCTISNNTTLANGGAIYIDVVSKLTIDQSTVSLNVAQASGGGIFAGNGADVTISNSTISGNTTPINGGGIYVGDDTATATVGKLTVTNSLFQANKIVNATLGRLGGGVCLVDTATASFADTMFDSNFAKGSGTIGCSGAAIGMFSSGDVTITRSTFLANAAGNSAAIVAGNSAIYQNASANLTIDQSTFSKNTSDSAGGAITFLIAGKTLLITNSTFEGNSSGNSGGALASGNTATGGNLIVRNSTFAGNIAVANGGAIRTFTNFDGKVTFQNCTLVGNTAAGTGGGFSQGGLANAWVIESTIVAQNLAGGSKNNVNADIIRNSAAGSTTVINSSLIGNKATTGVPFYTGTGNQEGTPTTLLDPLLSTLANFGGLTKVMVPQAGSKALNNGSNPAGLTTDQRATATFKRDWDSSGKPDIGAAEMFVPAPVVAAVTAPIVTTTGGTDYQFTIKFSDDQGINVSTLSAAGAVTVSGGKFASPVNATFVSVDTNTNGTPRTATFSITPPGGTWDFGDNGAYSISIVGSKIFDIDAPTAFSVPAGTIGGFTVGIGTTITVNAINDEAIDSDTLMSLREAIILTNTPAYAGNDTIVFDPTIFAAAAFIGLDITLGSISISDSVTINGPTAGLTLDGGFTSRILKINGAGTLVVSISNMNFNNGYTKSNAFGENGGAINIADENVTLTKCSFDNNSSSADGAAIGQSGGDLTIVMSTFTNNHNNNDSVTLNGGGAAVFYSGTGAVNVSDSTFMFNNGFGTGGAVSVVNASVFNVAKCTFEENSTTLASGGAVAANGVASMTMTNSTFTNNRSFGAGFVGGGVLLLNVASAMINNCTFTGNEQADFTTQNGGGGLAIIGATTVTVNNSTFTGNKVNQGNGGAIWVRGDSTASVTINRCTLDGNQALGAGNVGGGAVFVGSSTIATAGTKISIVESTLSNNSTTASGGAIAIDNKGQLTVTNSTLAYNTADVDGGAILLANQAFANLVQNSTLAFNTANGVTVGGGGIAITGTPTGAGALTLSSSIVANNTSPNTTAADVGAAAATNIAGANNIVLANLTGGVTYTGLNPQNGLDPVLNTTLQLNGAAAGSPLTLSITAASPAHDKGNNAGSLTTDQRGVGFNRASGKGADIGAFEVQELSAAKLVTIQVNDGSAQRSMVTSLKITFDSHVTFTGGAAAAFTLVNQKTSNSTTLAAAVDDTGAGTVVTLTFTGGSVDLAGSLADGRYTLNIVASGFGGLGFDGNGDGTAGDNFIEVGAPGSGHNLFRLFGDSNADGTVNGVDFLNFRLSFLQINPTFDYDASGQVNGADFLAFRLHFLQSV